MAVAETGQKVRALYAATAMRAFVLILNVVAGLIGFVVSVAAFYVGGWGLLGAAFGQPTAVLWGVLVVLAPPLITVGSIVLSYRLAKSGHAVALLVAAIPVLLGVAVIVLSPVEIGLNS